MTLRAADGLATHLRGCDGWLIPAIRHIESDARRRLDPLTNSAFKEVAAQ